MSRFSFYIISEHFGTKLERSRGIGGTNERDIGKAYVLRKRERWRWEVRMEKEGEIEIIIFVSLSLCACRERQRNTVSAQSDRDKAMRQTYIEYDARICFGNRTTHTLLHTRT